MRQNRLRQDTRKIQKRANRLIYQKYGIETQKKEEINSKELRN